MNNNIKKFNKAFTLVETLVAVTVLMIAVAGPLVVASKGLNASNYARDQMVAYYLAQESMEAIKNNRDNFITSNSVGAGAVERFVAPESNGFGNPSSCEASVNLCEFSTDSTEVVLCSGGGCPIVLDPTNGYGYDPVVTEAPYYRYYFIHPWRIDDSGKTSHATVTVVVKWRSSTGDNEVRLSSELNDAIR